MISLPENHFFHSLTFKMVESKVVKRQGMRADVCNCLFTTPLIGFRLPDILVPYLHFSEVCKLVPVNEGDVCGVYFHGTALRSHRDCVQKSQACAFEESGSGEINLCDPAALGEI